MNINKGNFCKLCFYAVEHIFQKETGILREIFDVILLNVNLNMTENPTICQNCAEKTLKCFYFKSLCIDTEKIILSFTINKSQDKFSLNDIYNMGCSKSVEAVGDEDFGVCRFCLKQLKSNYLPMDFITHETEFMEMLPLFMPEMDINLINDPIICISCRENLKYYLEFMWNYLNTIERTATYHRDDKITAQLKTEMEIKESLVRDEDYITTDGTSHNRHTLTHRTSSDIKIYKCELCTYETKSKRCLNMHILNHKSTSEVEKYRCEMCSFDTKYKTYLKYHMLVHKDVSEVEIYKCPSCTYKTRRKRCLNAHVKIHEDNSEVKIYKCAICTLETKYKSNLKIHMQLHRDPSERSTNDRYKSRTYGCTLCAYETKQSCHLKRHMRTHRDLSEIVPYKCPLCPKTMKHEDYLKKHMLRHKKANNENAYGLTIS